MVEIIVPYGDPRSPFQHKCAFDVMDYGLGATANSLELGCDCLGHIKYFDGMVNNSRGALCPTPAASTAMHVKFTVSWYTAFLLCLEGQVRCRSVADVG